jgi:hypothetical protein
LGYFQKKESARGIWRNLATEKRLNEKNQETKSGRKRKLSKKQKKCGNKKKCKKNKLCREEKKSHPAQQESTTPKFFFC